MSAVPNGFKISTWTELLAVLSIIVMAIAGLTWGLKLDGRSELQGKEIAEIRARQDDVRERLTSLEERVRSNSDRMSALELRLSELERDHIRNGLAQK